MAYFIFKCAANTDETGPVFPQVQKMSPGYDYSAPNSVYALAKEAEQLPSFFPNLDHFVVNEKAKLTDLLSVSVIHGGFLVSGKLKTIFERFNLPVHRFFPAKVMYKNKLHSYYWMHMINDLTDYVDYPRSNFFTYLNYSDNLGHIKISSKRELMEKKNQVKKDNPGKSITIWAERIQLLPAFDKQLDLFEIGMFDSNTYISDGLCLALLEDMISGVSILTVTNLFT